MDDFQAFAKGPSDLLDHVRPNYRDSAEYLLHYIALRSCDLRPVQMSARERAARGQTYLKPLSSTLRASAAG